LTAQFLCKAGWNGSPFTGCACGSGQI